MISFWVFSFLSSSLYHPSRLPPSRFHLNLFTLVFSLYTTIYFYHHRLSLALHSLSFFSPFVRLPPLDFASLFRPTRSR